ncbi:MAG TPA: ACT domain-containing protein, partial [archaeon]|nr:ACT domain-containing protein [archaeon]
AFKKSTLRLSKNLAMVTIKNSEEVEKTPGFIAYLYSLLGENNINVVETMSCWTDTIIVISEEDLARTIKFLKF